MSLVSICIPTYNGEKYLQQALNSVKVQTYKNFEVIISDDKSTDSTLEICKIFQDEVDFPVFIHHHEPTGIGANWNHCIKKANGQYIKFLFQDDILEPHCLKEQLLLIQKTKTKAVCCKRKIIDEKSDVISEGKWFDIYGDLHATIDFQNKNYSVFSKNNIKSLSNFHYNIFGEPDTFLYQKSLFKTIGFFNANLRQVLDLEYSYRILKKFPIIIQNKELIRFRLHDNQASSFNQTLNINEGKELENYVKKIFIRYLPSDMKKAEYIDKYSILKKIYHFKKKYLK